MNVAQKYLIKLSSVKNTVLLNSHTKTFFKLVLIKLCEEYFSSYGCNHLLKPKKEFNSEEIKALWVKYLSNPSKIQFHVSEVNWQKEIKQAEKVH